jgi:hypothetical protein
MTRSPSVLVHVHDDEAETLAHRGRQHQPRRVHRVGEGEVQRQVEGAGIGLVGGEEHERLGRAFLELHLRRGRPHAAHVAGEGVLQQVLAGAVQALILGGAGAGDEGIPRQFVDFGVAHAARVRHQDGDIVAGVADIAVEQQTLPLPGNEGSHRVEQALRRADVAADRADVGLDDAQGDFHGGHLPADRRGPVRGRKGGDNNKNKIKQRAGAGIDARQESARRAVGH